MNDRMRKFLDIIQYVTMLIIVTTILFLQISDIERIVLNAILTIIALHSIIYDFIKIRNTLTR